MSVLKISKDQNGSGLVIGIIIAAVIVAGGTAAYFVTKDSGSSSDNDNKSTTKVDSQERTAKDDASDEDQIPAGFPADMPIYEPSEIITSDKDEDGYSLGLQAKDASEEEVKSFYDTELAKAGWTSRHNLASSDVIEVEKGKWTGSVTIHESTTTNIGTTISYLLEEQ